METDAIYQCKRGKRIHHLEQISDELEAYFDENPPKDAPDAVRKIKKILEFLSQLRQFDTGIMNDSYLNSDIVCDGLERLRKRYPDQYLYIILDNAAYQHCRKIRDKAEK